MSDDVTLEFTHSPELGAFAKALAAAQSKMGGARKSGANPHLKTKYSTLDDAIDAAGPHLSDNGIAYSQLPFTAGREYVGVITIFIHESGQYMASKATIPVTKPDAQGHGSAYTYLRRYAFMAMAGIAPTDDDDGVEASKPAPLESQLRQSINWPAWADGHELAMRKARKVSRGELGEAWSQLVAEAKKLGAPPVFMDRLTTVKNELKAQDAADQAAQ